MRRLSLLAFAAICSVAAASAQTVPTKPSDHGMFDGGKFPPQAEGLATNPLPSASYASLPNSAPLGFQYFCTNCYSSARSSSSAQTGIVVTWNGASWTDAVGNQVEH
ncbi:MAG: hypothetical protein ABF812_08660 [Gluconobacter cerinus]|uniref:hypothetical protein n=1 Tax=Gluconobacter cerinus TaxID=38307 RepID=UPI0039E7D94B